MAAAATGEYERGVGESQTRLDCSNHFHMYELGLGVVWDGTIHSIHWYQWELGRSTGQDDCNTQLT